VSKISLSFYYPYNDIQPDEKRATSTLTRDIYKFIVAFNKSGIIQDPDPYSTHIGVLFWVGREVDGTSEQWHRILGKVLAFYSTE
jgi:hypothetical protein